MSETIYIIFLLAIAAVFFAAGYMFEKPSAFKRGWKAGSTSAVEWMTIALAESGFSGKQLQDLLTLIAGHLQELKDGVQSALTENQGENCQE